MYRIFHCKDSSNIPGSCSVLNLNGLRRNTSEYQAGVTADRVYHWQVKAVNNQGLESAWSELKRSQLIVLHLRSNRLVLENSG